MPSAWRNGKFVSTYFRVAETSFKAVFSKAHSQSGEPPLKRRRTCVNLRTLLSIRELLYRFSCYYRETHSDMLSLCHYIRIRNLKRSLYTQTAWMPASSLKYSIVHSVEQKSIGLKFSKSRTGSDVRYSCHHNSSRFTRTFPILAH